MFEADGGSGIAFVDDELGHMNLHGGLRDGWRHLLVPSRSLLHHRFAEPPAEHAEQGLSEDRFENAFSLASGDSDAGPATGLPRVDPAGGSPPETPPDETAFASEPGESLPEDVVAEDFVSEDEGDPDPGDDSDLGDVVAEGFVPEDHGDPDPEELEPEVPANVDPEVPEVPEVTAYVVPEVGRHRRPTLFEKVAFASRSSRGRLMVVVVSILVVAAAVLGVLFALV